MCLPMYFPAAALHDWNISTICFEVEIVAVVGCSGHLVMDISQSVACVRMLGRNMKVESAE